MRSVMAKFTSSSKQYEYFVPEGDTPQVGDFIVTSLATEAQCEEYGRHPVNMAIVVAVRDTAGPAVTKEYLLRISAAELKDRAVQRAKAQADRKARADALLKLKDLATEEMLLKTLAESTNPEIQRLLQIVRGN